MGCISSRVPFTRRRFADGATGLDWPSSWRARGTLLAVVALLLGSAQVSTAVLRASSGGQTGSIERGGAESSIAARHRQDPGRRAWRLAGVGFQALTRNPLAEPAVLGVSGGAAFGVVTGQIFGLGPTIPAALGLAIFAFAGARSRPARCSQSPRRGSALSIQTVLAGVIVGIFFSSAITVLISVLDFNRLGGVIHWLFGNLAPVPPGPLLLFALLTATGFWLVLGQARPLNLFMLGEETARQMGVDAERLKRRIFVGAALLTATVVAFAGPIGFVGLIVPHLLRGWLGQDNRLLIPTALLGGGIFLLAADTVARNIVAPAELSVGVITAFCGAPFFVYLLQGARKLL
jgi:iron complex transport system permease protein